MQERNPDSRGESVAAYPYLRTHTFLLGGNTQAALVKQTSSTQATLAKQTSSAVHVCGCWFGKINCVRANAIAATKHGHDGIGVYDSSCGVRGNEAAVLLNSLRWGSKYR